MVETVVLQPIMPLDLPVKVRSWELTVYPRSHIRRRFGVTRLAKKPIRGQALFFVLLSA